MSMFHPMLFKLNYVLGEEISFKVGGNSRRYKIKGWAREEGWGAWGTGEEASLRLLLGSGVEADLLLTANSWGFVGSSHPNLSVEVWANNTKVANWQYEISNNVYINKVARIPASAIDKSGLLNVTFKFDSPSSPLSMGISDDSRTLGIGITSLNIGTISNQ
jgi:hypothetical protein